MTIVNLFSTAMNQTNLPDEPRTVVDTRFAMGQVRAITGSIANASTDSSGSTYTLCRLPSACVLQPESRIDLQSWGFASVRVGIAGTEGGLISATAVSGLSAPSAPVVQFGQKWGQSLWEQLGLAEDPGGMLDLIISATADAASAGTVSFDLRLQID